MANGTANKERAKNISHQTIDRNYEWLRQLNDKQLEYKMTGKRRRKKKEQRELFKHINTRLNHRARLTETILGGEMTKKKRLRKKNSAPKDDEITKKCEKALFFIV